MNSDRENLTDNLTRMKTFESWASSFYLQVADDVRIMDEKVKEAFRQVAKEETEHALIVQRIINILNNSLI